MNILVVNQPLNNRGDQAAHRAFIRKLKESFFDSSITVLFTNRRDADVDEIKAEDETVNYINIKKLEKAETACIKMCFKMKNIFPAYFHPLLNSCLSYIKRADVVICSPGGICMGGFMNWEHVWFMFAAQKLKKKTAYWSRSIGPFSDEDKDKKLFKETSYSVINGFDYISLRDEISYKIAKSLRDDVDLTLDSVFLYQDVGSVPEELVEKLGNEYVVFVPNELTWHYDFRNINKDLLTKLYLGIIDLCVDIYPEHKIVMLPQLYNQPINDYKYFIELVSKSDKKDMIVVVEDTYSSDVQQAIIRNAKLMIGGRYHSIVFAINNQTPFVALNYEHKISGMLNLLCMQNHIFDIKNYIENSIDVEKAFIQIKDIIIKSFECLISNDKANKIVKKAYEDLKKSIT